MHELLEEEGLDGVSDTLLDEDAEELARSLTGDGVLLVREALLDRGGETETDEGGRALDFDEVDELDGGLLALDAGRIREDSVDVNLGIGIDRDVVALGLEGGGVDLETGGGRNVRHDLWRGHRVGDGTVGRGRGGRTDEW